MTDSTALVEIIDDDGDDDDDALLIGKIEALLSQQPHNDNDVSSSRRFSTAEQTLVALVLLSRVVNDHAYTQIWQGENCNRLLTFCQNEWISPVQQEEEGEKQQQQATPLWLRLQWMTLWIQRLLLTKTTSNGTLMERTTILASFRDMLWDILVNDDGIPLHDDLESSSLEAETQVMECLIALDEALVVAAALPVSKKPQRHAVDIRCRSLMQRIRKLDVVLAKSRAAVVSSNSNKNRNATKTNSSPQQSIMNETLRQLLPTHQQETRSSQQIVQRYETCCQSLCLQQGKLYVGLDRKACLTVFWTNLLVYFWSSNSASDKSTSATTKCNYNIKRRQEWALVLLELLTTTTTTTTTTQKDSSTTIGPDWWREFWSTMARWSCWTRLLTTSVAADDNILRTAAWTTATQVIQTTTWRTILALGSSSSAATWITLVVRLAVGEMKIQLGLIVSCSSTENIAEDRQILIQATCRIVVQCMDLIRELDDDDYQEEEESRVSLSAASIKSLHQSMEEALDTVVQYLNLADRRLPEIDGSTIQVLGCLLTEFDVFVRQSQQQHASYYNLAHDDMMQKDEESEENTTLLALGVAVNICPPPYRRELLLGLATVLASAEGDSVRVGFLKKTKLLDDELFVLLKACWTEAPSSTGTPIPEACDVIEVLMDVHPIIPISELQSVIIDWMKRVCNGVLPLRVDLEASLACYVRLQGETAPLEPHASTIRHAHLTLESKY